MEHAGGGHGGGSQYAANAAHQSAQLVRFRTPARRVAIDFAKNIITRQARTTAPADGTNADIGQFEEVLIDNPFLGKPVRGGAMTIMAWR